MITVTISSCCTRAFITAVTIVILPQWFKAFPSTWIYCPYKPTIIVVTVIFKYKCVSLFEGVFWFFRCLQMYVNRFWRIDWSSSSDRKFGILCIWEILLVTCNHVTVRPSAHDPLADPLASNKICKNPTNHPHLLRVSDDRKIVKINSFHASADGPLLVN